MSRAISRSSCLKASLEQVCLGTIQHIKLFEKNAYMPYVNSSLVVLEDNSLTEWHK